MTERELQQITRLVMNKIRNSMARGEILKVINGKTTRVKVSMLEGEVYDGIEMPHQFGFQANPPVGSECLVHFFGGNRDHGSVAAAFNKNHSIIDLEPGESAIFNHTGSKVICKANGDIKILTAGGAAVHIGNDGEVTITEATTVAITASEEVNVTAADQVTIDTPLVQMTGDLTVAGTINGV